MHGTPLLSIVQTQCQKMIENVCEQGSNIACSKERLESGDRKEICGGKSAMVRLMYIL